MKPWRASTTIVLAALARAVKASPLGGLRPALTALLLTRRQGKPGGASARALYTSSLRADPGIVPTLRAGAA